ncbi:MAG: hypothetical protein ACREU0_05905 [Burkholderiales bacterium]
MSVAIQDDILRRCLDFFGLRGVITHNYEQTVIPVVLIGDLGQPTRLILSNSTNINNPWGAVPTGKCWRPLYIFAAITQAAGTVARTYGVGWQSNGIQQGQFVFYHSLNNGNNVQNENIQRQMVLNTTDNVIVKFPPGFLLPSGAIIDFLALAGDGTTSIALGATLMVQELGENLIVQG